MVKNVNHPESRSKNVVDEVKALKKELFHLRLSVAYGQEKNVSQFKKIRKNVARLLTSARELSTERTADK